MVEIKYTILLYHALGKIIISCFRQIILLIYLLILLPSERGMIYFRRFKFWIYVLTN